MREAARSRGEVDNLRLAWASVALYNLVALFDIVSTVMAIGAGAGEEANPFMRAAMENLGPGWIGAKVALQAVISGMVIWFPHRIVLGIFTVALLFNAAIVINNFRIVYGF